MGRVPFSYCWFGRGSPYGWCFLFFSEMLRAAFSITALELDRVLGSLGLSALCIVYKVFGMRASGIRL